ncbi:MAG: alpha/beta hydrolase [Clostridia bacterium]|nr:alpha/beta hydrolase [Clostridia bacterium]
MDIPKGNIKQELIYKKTAQRDLMLTFLPPVKEKCEKAPVYFIIPGGGWHTEERQSMLDFSAQSVERLRNEGFAVVSVDYRVSGEGVCMREIITDCFDAARYIAHYADRLQIDNESFVLSGHSAGAHLALMLAYSPQEAFCDDYEWSDGFKVKCIAAMSAPTVLYDNSTNNLRNMHEAFLGCDTEKEKEFTSPITHVTENCPPTLLCAGTSDYLVFSSSSERLYKRLKEKNVPCELKLSVCGGHSFEKVHKDIEPSIAMEDIQSAISEFVMRHTISKHNQGI